MKFTLLEEIELKIMNDDDIEDFETSTLKDFGVQDLSHDEIKDSMKKIYKDGILVGYIGLSEYEDEDNPNMKDLGFGNFIVLPQFRGKGLSKEILSYILSWAKGKYKFVYCFVAESNTTALNLYKQFGEISDEPVDGYYFCKFNL